MDLTKVRSKEQGAALLIVLAFVVLLTMLSVAYLSRTTTDRRIAHGSFNRAKANELAESATDLIIGDFRQEIMSSNNSDATTVGSATIYMPKTSTNILPLRSGTPAPGDTPIPNLIRRSWTGDTDLNPRSRASNVSSGQDSLNGHSISAERWNKHYLVPRPAGANPTSTAPVGSFALPDWVIACRSGPVAFTTWNSVLADATPSNDNYAVGRYAYAVYDEGGLLDANVGGCPSGTSTSSSSLQYGLKGVSAFADLGQLGLTSGAIDALVGWRNYASAQPSGNFPNFNFNSTAISNYVSNSVFSRSGGFTIVASSTVGSGQNARTDQGFVSRQMLIQLAASSTFTSITSALQYLGTFSRELNAPSWSPTRDASDIGGNNGAGNIYAYYTNRDVSTAINRNFANVRVVNSLTRADGTTAQAGECLVSRRFPLTRLAGIGLTGPNTAVNSTIVNGVLQAASATTIQRDFGLIWDSANSRWNYVGASGTTVQTTVDRLDQVASENREPNFFELLKAAILSGSVGLGSGSANSFVASEQKYYITGTTPTNALSADSQIIQIGANIIDQQDTDKNPTFIYFGGNEFAGVENLPYLSKLVFQPLWTTGGGASFKAWVVPSFWMPAQNGTQIGTASTTIPSVRFVMTSGSLSAQVYAGTTAATSQVITAIPTTFSTQPYVQLAGNRAFGPTPTFQQYSNLSNPPRQFMTGIPSNSSNNPLGIETVFTSTPGITSATTTKAVPIFTSAVFEMQAQIGGSSGPWKTYQRWFNSTSSAAACEPALGYNWTQTTYDPEFVVLDPRTMRFGAWESDAKNTGTSDFTRGLLDSLDRPSPAFFQSVSSLGPQGSQFSGVGPQMANNQATPPNYTDLDAVRRGGDVISTGSTSEMLPTNNSDRPLTIDGSFQSVAQLGQVFRDQPWKTLALTTAVTGANANSADAGLLDVFTLHESSVEAGTTSLNTRQTPVLTAILSGTIKRLSDSTTAITTTQRNNIVTALANLTANQAIVNKAELATRLASDASVSSLGNKEARECVMRAFSDAGQTRAWDLLIDVIAQSGRYPSTATDLAQFMVDGEQRYWVHVAIDRFTGQVIDKQIEVVNE
jgi:Tfp pilus assembly protein PilX